MILKPRNLYIFEAKKILAHTANLPRFIVVSAVTANDAEQVVVEALSLKYDTKISRKLVREIFEKIKIEAKTTLEKGVVTW